MEQEVLVVYDIKIDKYVPVTQQWVNAIQDKISEYKGLIRTQKDQIERLEAMFMNYWEEALSHAFEECQAYDIWLNFSDNKRKEIINTIRRAHENHSMTFYTPPASDYINQIELEWKNKYKKLEQDFENYRDNAETAAKKALKQHSDT